MSTKIYDGFRMKNLSSCELVEFFNEIKQFRLRDYIDDDFSKLFADTANAIVSSLFRLEYNFAKNPSDETYNAILNYLKGIYISSMSDKDKNSILREGAINIDNMLQHFSFSYISNALNVVSNIYETQFNSDIPYSPYKEIKSSMSIHSLNKKWLLFIPYGFVLPKLFHELVASEKESDKAFVKKYNIEYYGYWDNTDKPDEISNREWNKRRKDWDIALFNGVPSECGICIENFINTMYFSSFSLHDDGRIEKIKGYVKPFNDLLKDAAYNIKIDEYIKNDSEYNPSSNASFIKLAKKYKEIAKDESSELYKEIESLAREYIDYNKFPDEKMLYIPLLTYLPTFFEEYIKRNPDTQCKFPILPND